MGITGEFVKTVFSKSRSTGTQESCARSNVMEKKKWTAVRSYLCGDEFNSVLAEEDSASVKSSVATVSQPILDDLTDKEDIKSEETNANKHNSMSKLFHKEDAAVVIQSAVRRFLARRWSERNNANESKQAPVSRRESPSRESLGTSIEVQTGNSTEGFALGEETAAVPQHMQQKSRTHIFRIKEDWDDSTVSSNVSKIRMQNKLEASTRRERALAYAFSQQKTQSQSDGTELNMGWSWLERWMATRVPDIPSIENHIRQQLEPFSNNQRSIVRKGYFDVAGEEKESCGSNEVSVQLDNYSVTAASETESSSNRPKATRTVSRPKTVPSYHCPKECSKAGKKECSNENDIDAMKKQKHPGNKKEIKCNDAAAA